MFETPTEPARRLVFEIGKLMKDKPPKIWHPGKKIVFEIAWPPGSRSEGKLIFTRWKLIQLPG